MWKFHKLQRGACLSLFVISSLYSIVTYHTNAVSIAALALIGIIAYDVVCFFKQKNDVKDYGPEIEKVKAENVAILEKLQEIRNDASIGKLAETFKRK